MATILLNGEAFDASKITDQNDKLTVSGGTDALDVSLLGGDDLIEVATQSEDITSSKMDGGDDDDEIIIALNGEDDDFNRISTISGDSTIRGGKGFDTIDITDGNVVLKGLVNGNDGFDSIDIVRADGATIQGGKGQDTITLGTISPFEEAGSRAANSIDDTEIYGGKNRDLIFVQDAAELTASVEGILNGGNGNDYIEIADDAIVDSYAINGNKGKDVIIARGSSYTDTTIFGGKGHDMLRIGGGVTAVGGLGADTFSIESEGGVTITDYDAVDDDCFCSDVIQVDGNKIFYDTYQYKQTTDKYTSLSSYKGNIKVKAFELPVNDTCVTDVGTGAIKTHTVNATAYLKYNITKTDESWKEINGGNGDFKEAFSNLKDASFPATYKGLVNGNSPRPDNDVKGIGYGYGSVAGIIYDRKIAQGGNIGNTLYERLVAIPNLTVYTSNKFEKGDFSFLNETANAKCTVTVKQTLVFDDVTRATITNHWVDFGVKKTTTTKSFYDLKFGTANFDKVTTGKANLVITKGLVDKTYYPTPGNITNDLKQAGFNYNTKQTADGKYVYTRTANATANANAALNLSSQPFALWTKRNSGIGNEKGFTKTIKLPGNDAAAGFTLVGYVTADNGFYQYGTALNANETGVKGSVLWTQAQRANLLTHIVATNVAGVVIPGTHFPSMNVLPADKDNWNTFKVADIVPENGSYQGTNDILLTNGFYQGKTATVVDTRTQKGSLVAKIGMINNGFDQATASLPSWLGRALIKEQQFTPTDCFFDNPLTPEFIAGGVGGNQNNHWTPASISLSNKGEFGTKYMWTSGALRMNLYGSILDLPASNGCNTEYGVPTEFSCDDLDSVNAKVVIDRMKEDGVAFENNGFFSAKQFTVASLAAAGMGEYADDAKGAPFRVLFFDNDGDDKGLYVMSGSANYKDGDVTAINTNPTGTSAFGGKQTIVKVTAGKGYADFSLSDINFV